MMTELLKILIFIGLSTFTLALVVWELQAWFVFRPFKARYDKLMADAQKIKMATGDHAEEQGEAWKRDADRFLKELEES